MGPITKLLSTLEDESDPNTAIIIVDDDTIYPRDMIEKYVRVSVSDPSYVVASECAPGVLARAETEQVITPQEKFNAVYGFPHDRPSAANSNRCCCQFFAAFKGVLFRRFMFNNDTFPFQKYLQTALSDPACFRSDDLLVSNYLTMTGYKGLHVLIEVDQLVYGFHKDALHRLETLGHPYQSCMHFLRGRRLASIMHLRLDPELAEGDVIRGPDFSDKRYNHVYLYQNGHRRVIPNEETAITHGWNISAAKILDIRLLHHIPLGRTILNTKYPASYPFRIVVSLTTTPKRIHKLSTVLTSLLDQSLAADVIQVNIPYVHKLTGEEYPSLDQFPFLRHNRIRVKRFVCRMYVIILRC